MPAARFLLLLALACTTSKGAPQTEAIDDSALPEEDSALPEGDTAEPLDSAGPDPPAPCTLWPEVEGDYLPLGTSAEATLPPCEARMIPTAGAVGMTLSIELLGWSGANPPLLWVTDPASRSLQGPTLEPAFDITLLQSGEAFVHILPQGATEAETPAYRLQITCIAGCDTRFTRYPLVLMHGMAGFDELVGVNYFLGVREDLTDQGYLVAEPGVSPFAAVEDRAAQWSAALDALEAEGYGRRFNLIAHSQAGLDSRYLIATLGQGERVASLDTIATPHFGSPIADLASGAIEFTGISGSLLDLIADLWAGLNGIEDDQDVIDSAAALTTAQLAIFNDENPDDPDVYYRSWSGHTCDALDFGCQGDYAGERVNLLLWPTFTALQLMGLESDGMVPVDSAVWGDWQGEIPGDHIDEVAELGGLGADPFDHLAFYQAEAAALAARGL